MAADASRLATSDQLSLITSSLSLHIPPEMASDASRSASSDQFSLIPPPRPSAMESDDLRPVSSPEEEEQDNDSSDTDDDVGVDYDAERFFDEESDTEEEAQESNFRSLADTFIVSCPAAHVPSTNDEDAHVPTELNRFPKLPKEVRLMIWRLAVAPRMVLFPTPSMEERSTLWRFLVDTEPGCEDLLPPDSNKTPLALLGVCQESRNEIAPIYRKMFAFDHDPALHSLYSSFYDEHDSVWPHTRPNITGESEPYRPWTRPKVVYEAVIFNPDVDCLLIDSDVAADMAYHGATDDVHKLSHHLKELRYLAVYDDLLQWKREATPVYATPVYFCRVIQAIFKLFLNCPKLERIYVLLSDISPVLDEEAFDFRKRLEESIRHYVHTWLDYWEGEYWDPIEKKFEIDSYGEEVFVRETEEGENWGFEDLEERDKLRKVCHRWKDTVGTKYLYEAKIETGVTTLASGKDAVRIVMEGRSRETQEASRSQPSTIHS